MNKISIILIIIILSIVGIAGYSFYKNNSPVYKTPIQNNTAQNQQPTQTANSSDITIQNFSFNPTTLTIKAGTTVVWTNKDPIPHQIKSSTFNSSQLNTGDAFSFTFPDAGTYNYSCAIHPSMIGQIIVTQ